MGLLCVRVGNDEVVWRPCAFALASCRWGEEVDDGAGEGVVGVTGHHVAGTMDVEVLGVGDGAAELRRAVFGEQVAVRAPHEQARHASSVRGGV